jgi:hypothetical protein
MSDKSQFWDRHRTVEALLRTDPLLSTIYRKHYEVAWLLALSQLGWLDDEELLACKKVIPLTARSRLGFRLPGGYTFYPNGDPTSWEGVPASAPPGPVEFMALEEAGGCVGAVPKHWPLFDVSHIYRPADRIAWGSKDAAGTLEPGVAEPKQPAQIPPG